MSKYVRTAWAAVAFMIMTSIAAMVCIVAVSRVNGDVARGTVIFLFMLGVVAMGGCLWGIAYDER